jgi:hypothetical protein
VIRVGLFAEAVRLVFDDRLKLGPTQDEDGDQLAVERNVPGNASSICCLISQGGLSELRITLPLAMHVETFE